MNDAAGPLNVFTHAATTLTAVTVDTYNEELREGDGFVGDRASGRAFRKILDECRAKLENSGHEDPFGEVASREISKSKLDKILVGKDPIAAGLVHTAVEEFGKELAERHPGLHGGRGVEGYGAHSDRRRLDRQPHRRARHGTRRHHPDGRLPGRAATRFNSIPTRQA